jgi:hypothetical protein
LVASALVLGAVLGGCGKASSTPAGAGSGEADLNPVVAVGVHGAAGQITKNTTRLGGATAVIDAAAVATAVHPGLDVASRPQAVVVASKDDFFGALAASVLAAAPLGAPLLYSEADLVPGATSQALESMAPTGASALSGARVVKVGDIDVPPGYTTDSLSATEPSLLAAEIERIEERVRGSAPRQVIVVNTEAPEAIAMPAAGLAAESGAPILAVSSHGIPGPTRAVLKRLKHPSIYAIGPSTAISETVLSQLEKLGAVRRIAGATAAENAIEVARFSEGAEASEFGFGVHEAGHGLVFASASRPLDAPAAASLSASGDFGPLLLTETAGAIPLSLSGYLSDIQAAYSAQVPPTRGVYNRGWIIGDELAVSATVAAELDSMLEIADRGSAATPSYHP